jgi:hypothetical protein
VREQEVAPQLSAMEMMKMLRREAAVERKEGRKQQQFCFVLLLFFC